MWNIPFLEYNFYMITILEIATSRKLYRGAGDARNGLGGQRLSCPVSGQWREGGRKFAQIENKPVYQEFLKHAAEKNTWRQLQTTNAWSHLTWKWC